MWIKVPRISKSEKLQKIRKPSSTKPVCLNNQTYFSPCHAGCTEEAINGTIAGCGCAADQIAFEGYCPNPEQEKVFIDP